MNSNNNAFYINRIIKLISPLTCQTFKIELNGEENELRELLGTILEINPKSIKGLRDSYNNYYTLSSAVKNPHINTDPFNYYTVVIKGAASSNNLKYMKYPSLNIYKKEMLNTLSNESNSNFQNNLNKSLSFFENDDVEEEENTLRYLYNKSNKGIKNGFTIQDFLKFAEDLYKRKYIDHSLERKLKKLIKENNKEVLSILNPYLNLKSKNNYDELAKKIKPVISSRSVRTDNIEESKQKSSSQSEHSIHNNSKKEKGKEKEKKTKRENKENKNNKNTKSSNNNKAKTKLSNEEKILEDIKLNFNKEKYEKLKELLEQKNQDIIKIIKNFEKNNDYNHLLSKLSRLVENFSDNSNEEENEEENITGEENDSSYYIREDVNSEKNNKKDKKNKKSKSKSDSVEIQKIIKNIYNYLKGEGKDLYYLAKYDFQKLKNDEKIELFTKKFKLNLDKINNDNYKIPNKKLSGIRNYYNQYIIKKICKNFNENEKQIFENLLDEDEETNIIFPLFKELLNHKDINKLRNKIKKVLEEAAERIDEEDNEDEDGKNSMKEENEENEENEEEEDDEEEEEGEGEEEEDGEGEEDEENQDEKDSDNHSNKNSSSNKDTFILKDGNKDRAANILNNNYKKINNINNNLLNNNNNKNNDDENKDNNNQNLGLGFVVVKQKKQAKDEEQKDPGNDYQNNETKLNATISQAKESSQSTNNPNKKLNQFIAQIEHMKKIDDIKKTIIEAIHENNKYVMDLFQKFQKNKLNLNPKSLNAVYKQIKENPDTNSKAYIFKSLIKEVPGVNEFLQEFLCDEFINNKNDNLETFYSLYMKDKEKNDFIESIEMFLKKQVAQKALVQYSLKRIKSEISPNLLQKDVNDNNEELVNKSKEIIKIMKKYNLFNENEYNIIMYSLDNDDDVLTATFQVLFDDKDLIEFYETITLALNNQINVIKKNYKEIKKRIEEKHLNTLEELYKNDNLYNILKDLNSSNINEKVENIKTLILKKELTAT